MLRRAGHASECVRKSGGDGEDRKEPDQIGKRRGILKRMGAVGVKETAAVGAPLLDEFLRCQRSLGDNLIGDDLSFLRGRPICVGNDVAGGTEPPLDADARIRALG